MTNKSTSFYLNLLKCISQVTTWWRCCSLISSTIICQIVFHPTSQTSWLNTRISKHVIQWFIKQCIVYLYDVNICNKKVAKTSNLTELMILLHYTPIVDWFYGRWLLHSLIMACWIISVILELLRKTWFCSFKS